MCRTLVYGSCCIALLCGCASQRGVVGTYELATEVSFVEEKPSLYRLRVKVSEQEQSGLGESKNVIVFPDITNGVSQSASVLSTSNYNNQIVFVPSHLGPTQSGVELEFRVSETNKHPVLDYKVKSIDLSKSRSIVNGGSVILSPGKEATGQ